MRFKKIISIAMSAIIAAVSASTFSGTSVNHSVFNAVAALDENVIYNSWQEAYKEKLIDIMNSSMFFSKAQNGEDMCSTYAIRDLNNDGTPELFVNYAPATFAHSELYTFYGSKIIKLMTLPRAGFVSYSTEKGLIYSCGGGGAGGYVYHTYSKILNGKIVDVDSFMISAGTTPITYMINEEQVSESEYNVAKKQYDSINWTTVGREKFFEDINSDIDLLKTYNSWQEAYKEKLIDIMNSSMFFSKAQNGENMCSTYAIRDLNNDGTPELFVNYAPATFAHSELYTFYGSKLIKLMTLPRAGFVSYSTEKGLIYSCGGGGAGGYVYHTYSKILNGRIVDVDSFMISAGTTPITYMINEEQVSESEYNVAKKQYDSINWTTVGREKFFEDINSDISFTITTTTTTTKRTTTSTTTATTTTTKMTTATTTTTRKVTSTTPSSTTTSRIMLGDVNVDKNVNAVDASYILSEYVISSTGGKSEYKIDKIAADVDGNGRIDSCDASCVLLYYRYISTCASEPLDLQEYIQSCKTDSPNVDVTLSLTQKKLTYDEARSSPIIEIILSAKSANATKFDSTGIHIKIDSGLELVQTDYMGEKVWAYPKRRFEAYQAVQDGTDGLFLTSANTTPEAAKSDGLNLWSFKVKVKNPEAGKKYPIQIVYRDGDLFDNCLSNDTEKLRENAFSHIEQGYIEIIDSPQTTTSKATTPTTTTAKPTTTTSTTQGTTAITTTTANGEFKLEVTSIAIKNGNQYTIPINRDDIVFKSTNPDVAVVSPKGVVTAIGTGEAVINVIDKDYNVIQLKVSVQSDVVYPLGDINNDGQINAVDASTVLSYYAMISTNKDGGFDDKQKVAADVNKDGLINAVDASCILSYYAYTSTTKDTTKKTLEEFLKS